MAALQADVQALTRQIEQLKQQQDDSSSKKISELNKAADKLGVKLAQQRGRLETHQDDVQARKL